ncbi:hypothetical protein KP004_09955 [Geomonas oryzisoli]|uniref:Uncharacterized protein n=1 Tax=Geomonas oryzisoli TaxID=2847992 RepID=A0ABX8JAK4_9BACT|nr:hypothetical protein [Geomonas oryzisoli]QWV95468.1 hypothetical protein KP004_09955 [Geomonas oryzisoli]
MHRIWLSFLFFSVCALSFVIPPSARGSETIDVRVNNFPRTQTVNGSVSLEGTTKAAKVETILLPPSRRGDPSEMVYAGRLDTETYTSVSLMLQGEIKSTSVPLGTVGVVLVPDEEPIQRVLKDAKLIQFPLETSCNIKSGDSEYFSCDNNHVITFPRYRIYLYNTLNKSAEVNVYLYLRK